MKHFIASILLTFTALAATAGGNYNFYDAQARDIARRMANQIELNEMEYIQVKKFTVEKIQAVAYIKDMYQTNPSLMVDRLNEVEELYNDRITFMLNSKQFENYLALGKSYRSELPTLAEDRNQTNLLR